MLIGGRRFLLSLAVIGASVCLALGVTLPIIKLTKYVFFTTEHSLVSTVYALINDGQMFLGVMVLVFSILLPALKLVYLLAVSSLPVGEIHRQSWRLRAIEWLGKWAMHDVLVLALTIFFIKSQGLYDAASLLGVYFFTAAVMLMILSYAWLRADVAADISVTGPADYQLGPPNHPVLYNFVLSTLIILATTCLVLGLIQPVIRFTTVFVWTNVHSIATIIYALYENEEYFLCAVLFLFSVFFPFIKLFYLLTLVMSQDVSHDFRRKSMNTMEWLGRYSMTDVMVLALIIFYVNSSGYTEASVLPGVYFFASSVALTMLACGWANSLPKRKVVREVTGPSTGPKPVPSLEDRLRAARKKAA